ncbi:MAG: response regulator [Candidatus Kaelpia aquatica]|nr:response regulator [Candidatus Kaelpia aquatica]
MKKILIIDDEDDLCQLTKLRLEKTGKFEVLTSAGGTQGIKLAKEKHPDLILLDVLMPLMSGPEVAECLLKDPAINDIAIIFFTVIVSEKEVRDSKGMIGGREFIAKSIKSEELIRRIEKALEE